MRIAITCQDYELEKVLVILREHNLPVIVKAQNEKTKYINSESMIRRKKLIEEFFNKNPEEEFSTMHIFKGLRKKGYHLGYKSFIRDLEEESLYGLLEKRSVMGGGNGRQAFWKKSQSSGEDNGNN